MDRQERQDSHLTLTSSGLNGIHPGNDRARTFPLRAEPLSCVVTHEHAPGMESTSIARLFAPGDVCRCLRCDICQATPQGLCLVTVPEIVPDDAARLFSLADWRIARGLA